MKRLTALILACVMLLSCMMLTLTSCGEEETTTKNPTTNNNNHDSVFQEGDIFAERAATDDGLDEWDFEGKTLRVVCHNDGYEVFPAEADINKGDLVKDAKAKRNEAVEEKLNCNLELAYAADITTMGEYISKSILSGTDEFDLVVAHVMTCANLTTKNLFLNWYEIPHVDFSKPWWAASTSTELTYDGKCILAISDINVNAITSTCALAFNKNLAAAYDLGNLYELVLDGKWTYDTMYNMLKDVYIDSDGSGTRSNGDFYGGTFEINNRANAFLWAFDNPIVQKDEEGIPQFAIKTDKINNIMQTLFDFYYNTTGIGSSPDDDDFEEFAMFLNKQSIMTTITLGSVMGNGLRNFEDEYGILPYPKWDEYQKNYYSHVYGEHTVSCVPKTAKDLEFIGVCAEALAYESWKTITPTIYETALKTRYLRDSESKVVLDIILDYRYFDFGFVFDGFHGYGYTVKNMLEQKIENFESYYAKQYPDARVQLKKVIRAFDKLG